MLSLQKITRRLLSAFAALLILLPLSTLSAFAKDSVDTAAENDSEITVGHVVFLLYHDLVAEQLTEANDPEYCTTAAKFRSDLQTMLDAGWKSLSCERYLNGEYEIDENYFVVTFDDGYLSNYEIAFPILRELNVYGDIFMCTSNVILANHFKWRQGQIMEDSGLVKLYSHTPNHKPLSSTTLPTFKSNLSRSFVYISSRLSGEHEKLFSYPNSDYTPESVMELYNMGVKLQFVQLMPSGDADWDWESYGLTRRYNVAYETDIMELIETGE